MRTLKAIVWATLAGALCCCGGRSATSAKETAPQTAAPQASPAFSADSAMAHIRAQVAFGPRVPGTKAHSDAVDYIVARLRQYGVDTVMTQRATVNGPDGSAVPVVNIIGRIGADRRRRILLAAHYDSRPWADNDPDPANHARPVDGANDGASGVAVLLEIARMAAAERPDAGVDIVMFDAEDMGLEGPGNDDTWCLGSQYWAANLPYSAAERPAYGILLDMVGDSRACFRKEYLSERFAPQVNQRVWHTAARLGYGEIFADGQGGAVTDDHLPVNRAGIPCIDIIDCVNPATGGFPLSWHTVDDTPAHISTRTLKAVGQTVAEVLYSEKSK